jgi:bifunctional enzyme CysN/CysC
MEIVKITLLGHKDHGKSTLIGTLLMKTGTAFQRRIDEAKRASSKLGKRFEPGFILDSFSEERAGGLTIDTSRAQVKYNDLAFEFIDVPGHEELIKNMISGASYADIALLVVSADSDEGIRQQTKRHVFLAKMLGIKKLAVAVNKMDTVKYSKDRFDGIAKELETFFNKIGMVQGSFVFVPVSAYKGENLIGKEKKLEWYKGKPLMDVLSFMAKTIIKDSSADETRIMLQGNVTYGNTELLLGKIISGKARTGQEILIAPAGRKSKIISLFVKGKKKQSAVAGQNVAIEMRGKIDGAAKGLVVYDSHMAGLHAAKSFAANVFIVKKLVGDVTLLSNGQSVGAKVKIKRIIDAATGVAVPGAKQELNVAETEITLLRPIAVEQSDRSAELGRFIIQHGHKFSAIGTITKITEAG